MNEREFESKVVQLRKKAVATCLACGASLTQAEDVAQDVMLRLWQLRESLDRYRSLEALVVVMARHNLSSMRRNDHNSVSIMTVNSRELPAQPITADASLISSQEVAWLNEAMRRLPGTQYAVLHMRQVECLSYDEIALRLGIENSTARSLLSKARVKLLNEIKKRNQR
ncbi:MAG: sigma-70 family RNA polymerase sigma factor [Bacteroidales bacterium]|nr:sigma-70 family RNA polymerase sigma factor [Bacteroidales bacterium]